MKRTIIILFIILSGRNLLPGQDSVNNNGYLPSKIILFQNQNSVTEDYKNQLDSFLELGRYYYQRGLYDYSCRDYSKAESIIIISDENIDDERLFLSHSGYAASLIAAGSCEEAPKYLELASRLDITKEERASLYGIYSDYYLKLSNIPEAEKYFRKYAEFCKKDVRYYLLKIGIEREMKNYEAALSSCDSLLKVGGEKYLAYNELGEVFEKMGNYRRAAEYYFSAASKFDSVSVDQMRSDLKLVKQQIDTDITKIKREEMRIKSKSRTILSISLISILVFGFIAVIAILIFTRIKYSKKLISSQNDLKKAIEKIRKESQVKTVFLKNLSSEIRTPLNEIVLLSDRLSSLITDDMDFKKYSRIIHESSDQLVKLVNDSVDISDYDIAKQSEYVYAALLVKDSINYLDIPLREGVSVEKDIPADYPEIKIQKSKVIKILSNLIHNAAKFTVKGTISIKCRIVYNIITFTVTDTGCGIPAGKEDYVFEYFTKLDTMCQGLGLGLPLSRLLAESMGGSLTLDASYTDGCRFILTFPLES